MRFPRVARLDRYIVGEILGPFAGGIVFFSFIFLMFQVLRLAEFFIVHGVSAWVLLRMIGLLLLSFLPMALPVAFLIGVLAAFGRFSSESELVAMKANGIGLSRLSRPAFAMALVVAALSLALNLEWVPRGDRELRHLTVRIGNSKAASALKEGTFTSGFFDLLVYAERIDPETGRLHGVFIYNDRDKAHPHAIVAQEGEIVPLRTASEFDSAVVLRLLRGSIHRSQPEAGNYHKIDFQEDRILLEMKEGQGGAARRARVIPFRELLGEIRQADPTRRWSRELKADLSRRFGIAAAPLLFVLLGMGLGISRSTRNPRANAALIAFLVVVAYWVLQASFLDLGHRNQVNPYLAPQVPNLVALLVGLRAYLKANW
jgi:LPS export ABC transporter permease LptF